MALRGSASSTVGVWGGGGRCRNVVNATAIKADRCRTLQRHGCATPSSSNRGCRPVDLRQVDIIRDTREGGTAAREALVSCPHLQQV